ncbi:MAG: hypothetical protein LBB40_03515 [Holophagales bacterium]|jgi:response regulator RpfG family c-di-GMP phosphodiesterase|nr:hypothetical protein [Holophagales bacterium]
MLDMWKRLTLTAKITLLFTTLNVLILVVYNVLLSMLQISRELQIFIAICVLIFSFIITLLSAIKFAAKMINKEMGESKRLVELQNAILKVMASLTEFRDEFTGGHLERTQYHLGTLLNAMKKQDVYREEVS